MARNYIFAAKVNFKGSRNDRGAEGRKRRRNEGQTEGGKGEMDRAGRERKENKEEEEEEVRDGGRKQKKRRGGSY